MVKLLVPALWLLACDGDSEVASPEGVNPGE
jgi:hypothetical protein